METTPDANSPSQQILTLEEVLIGRLRRDGGRTGVWPRPASPWDSHRFFRCMESGERRLEILSGHPPFTDGSFTHCSRRVSSGSKMAEGKLRTSHSKVRSIS